MLLTNVGRSDLVRMVENLQLIAERSRAERDAYLQNLTSTQERCTELLLETRELRKRLSDTALLELCAAISVAREKHPGGCNINALVEEVGEVCRAVRCESKERVRAELLDVAVVAMRLWLGELTPTAELEKT